MPIIIIIIIIYNDESSGIYAAKRAAAVVAVQYLAVYVYIYKYLTGFRFHENARAEYIYI